MTIASTTESERAMLRTVSLDLIVQECARRGHQVCLHTLCRLSDRLPAGYPPLADDDVPFDEKPPTQSGRRLGTRGF